MSNPADAATPEAKILNLQPDGKSARYAALDDRGERMAMYPQLPDGRCWDAEHLAMCKDINEGWAPFVVIRKMLIEAGARNIGSGILMSQAEHHQWFDYCDALQGKLGVEAMQKAREDGSGIRPFKLREL